MKFKFEEKMKGPKPVDPCGGALPDPAEMQKKWPGIIGIGVGSLWCFFVTSPNGGEGLGGGGGGS